MVDYKKITVDEIRIISDQFSDFSDEEIAEQYREWSEQFYLANWIDGREEEFVQYATNRPIDLWRMTRK